MAATSTIRLSFRSPATRLSWVSYRVSIDPAAILRVSHLRPRRGAKRLELIRELVPNARRVGLLVNPNSAGATDDERQLEAISNSAALQLLIIKASGVRQIIFLCYDN
jgi:hypothetical protein